MKSTFIVGGSKKYDTQAWTRGRGGWSNPPKKDKNKRKRIRKMTKGLYLGARMDPPPLPPPPPSNPPH